MKKFVAILTAGLLVIGALCLAGCGQDNAQLIREKLAEELDAFKNMDDSAMSQIATVAENAGLDEAGIDSQEFAAAVLEGFDYSIDNVAVDGNNAVATVTIVSKSSSDFEKRINEAIQSITNDADLQSMDQDAIMDKLSSSVMQAFADTEIITETADIEYALNGNTWEPVQGDNSLAELDSIIFAQ